MSNDEYQQQEFWRDKIYLVEYPSRYKTWYRNKETYDKQIKDLNKFMQDMEYKFLYEMNGK